MASTTSIHRPAPTDQALPGSGAGGGLTRVPVALARWSATHPKRAIGAWLGFVVVAVLLAVLIPTTNTDEADFRVGESGRAAAMLERTGLSAPAHEIVVIDSPDRLLDRATTESDVIVPLARSLRDEPGVSEVSAPRWSPDGTSVLLSVELASGVEDVAGLQTTTAAADVQHPDLRIREAGDLSIDSGIDRRVASDLSHAEGISLPITVVLMLVAFGSLVAAGLPILLAVTSVAAAIGILAPLSHVVPADPTVTSMIVLIGMAVGVDYSLFYLKRERQERRAGASALAAVEIAAQTSGHSILVSGFAVIASMSGLYLAGGATFSSLASGAIVVVAVAVLGSLTVLPALLAQLGGWVERPRVPGLWRLAGRIGANGLSSHLLRPVVRHPVAALLAASAVVTLIALPAIGMRIHSGNLDTLPRAIPEVQTMHYLSTHFPAEGASAVVVVEGPHTGESLRQVRVLAAGTGDFVEAGQSPITSSKDGEARSLTLTMAYDESDPRAEAALRNLREDVVPAGVGAATKWAVGGGVAEGLDYSDRLDQRIPMVVGAVVLLTMVMMGVAFRSVPIALVSALLTLVSVAAAFGLLTLVFQDGWGSGLLDFQSAGFVIDWVPLVVLVVLVGLSMDYHVFVVGRIRELVAAGFPARLAVRRGIEDTAGVVTSAATVMVSVFAIFVTLSLVEMKMIGVGLAGAILLDATLIRLVMLPAILLLLGERAWWPSRPSRSRSSLSQAQSSTR